MVTASSSDQALQPETMEDRDGLGAWLRRLHLFALVGSTARVVERRRRGRKIDRYLQRHAEPRMQLGSGGGPIPGWLNTDYHVNLAVLRDPESTFVDLLRPLPLADCSLSAITSEHVIEHFDLDDGTRLIHECFRVLRPGGVLRLVTPDLTFLAGLLEDPLPTPEHAQYAVTMLEQYWPDLAETGPATGEIVFNRCLREWGHRFAYTEAALTGILRRAGFVEIERAAVGVSREPALCGIESRPAGTDAFVNALESLVVEARRPPT